MMPRPLFQQSPPPLPEPEQEVDRRFRPVPVSILCWIVGSVGYTRLMLGNRPDVSKPYFIGGIIGALLAFG